MTYEKRVLSILVDNEPGVLSRIAGLFSGRGYNIESLCVAETMDPDVSSRRTHGQRGSGFSANSTASSILISFHSLHVKGRRFASSVEAGFS